jgi:TolB-like protein/Tfp pilus assembly protein PilF
MQQELINTDLTLGFRLGEWLVRPRANKLINDDGEVHVEPKIMDVLVCLAEAKGQVVTRRDLLQRVWDRVVVNEEALTRTISELRNVLADSANNPTYIKTIPKRGYSLIAPVGTTGIADISRIAQPDCDREGLPSIAVLPFVNLSADKDNEYFSDGLTEELIAMLTQIRGLHVAARTSVFSFKGTHVNVKEIGENLNVSHVLEGSVRATSSELRITTQLVEVDSGFQIWSGTFDRKMQDIFKVQEGIALAVVDALRLKLGVDHAFTPVNAPTSNLIAYELFLKGRLKYQNEQYGLTYSGIDELQQAVEISPNFPDAHGLKAYIQTLNSITRPYRESQPAIQTSYEAALGINPFQEEALMAKAIAMRWQSWDWVQTKSIFERALAAAPNCPHVLTQYACRFYRDLCVFDKAQQLLERAVTLDPINAAPRASLSFVLRYQRQYEAALAQAEIAISINASHGYANSAKIFSLISLAEFSAAAESINTIERIVGPQDTLTLNCWARLHSAAGDVAKTNQALKHLVRISQGSQGEQYMPLVGWVHLIQGDVEQAVDWLQKGFENQISQVLTTRAFAQILDGGERNRLAHPLLQDFLSQMNLDDRAISKYCDSGLFEDQF